MSKTASKEHFTIKFLESLKPQKERYNVFDADTRGLAVCVHPSGTKTFFHLRKVQGWPQRTTFDTFPELSLDIARGKAADLNSKLSKWKANDFEGSNPVLRPKKVHTLGDVLEHYVENHLKSNAKDPKHAEWYARWQFDRYLASWRNRPLSTIRRLEDIKERHAEIAREHGGVTANRVITFLRTLFGHALHPDIELWKGVNPARNPKKFLAPESGRERTLKPGIESRIFFKVLAKESYRDLKDAVLLAIFTAQRRGSILTMRWTDLDLRRGLWTVTTRKSKKVTETDPEPHIVPLVDEAITLLKRRPRIDGNDWVFPGRKQDTALTTLKGPWSEFIKKIPNDPKDPRLTFHDLRRSAATAAGNTGATKEVIQKTLGHSENSTATKIYDRANRRQAVRSSMRKATKNILDGGKVSIKKLLAAPRA